MLDGHIPGAVPGYWLDDLSASETAVTSLLPGADQAER